MLFILEANALPATLDSCPNACKICSNYDYCTLCKSGYTLTTSFSITTAKTCIKVKSLQINIIKRIQAQIAHHIRVAESCLK